MHSVGLENPGLDITETRQYLLSRLRFGRSLSAGLQPCFILAATDVSFEDGFIND